MAWVAWLISGVLALSLRHGVVRGSSLSTRLLCRHLGVLAGVVEHTARGTVGRSRDEVGNGLCDSRNNKPAKFLVFLLILLLQTEALFLAHVFSSKLLYFLHEIKHDLFGASVAFTSAFALSYVSSCDIGGAVNREGDAV